MKKLWFRAKTYGWGWTPSSFEGWALTLLFVLVLVGSAAKFSNYVSINGADTSGALHYVTLAFSAWIALLVFLFLYLCLKTGERPSWHWGNTS